MVKKIDIFSFFPVLLFLAVFLLVSFEIFPGMGEISFSYAAHSVADTSDAAAGVDFFNSPNLPTNNILLLLVLSFAAGILSFLSPCTLPILPAYFAVTFQVDRKRIFMMSLVFFLGLSSLFVMMGASASLLGSVLREHLFSLTRVGGIAIVIFGFMTLFGKGFSGMNVFKKPSSTYIGSFFFGATFALGWTPCIGPILSGILVLAAADKTVYQGMLLLFSFALGLGLPLIIISSFFGNLSKESLFWRVLRGHGWSVKVGGYNLYLHTTNISSGILLIGLGFLLATGYLTMLNSFVPIEMQTWFNQLEHKMMELF